MKQVNKDRLRQAINDIEKSINRLNQLGRIHVEEFLSNEDYQDIARSRLLTAIEAAINICYHIVAKKLNRVPTEYGQCFKIMGEENLIPPNLAERLALMCKFRNRLVHLYWNVDYKMVYDIIHTHVSDLEQFAIEIKRKTIDQFPKINA